MKKPDDDEFFIGYAPPMPPRLGRFVARVVLGVAAAVALWAVVAAVGHVRLTGGNFAFGHPQSFSGTISGPPYPRLWPDSPGPGAAAEPTSWLLVGPGKHGAEALVAGVVGRHVTLTGTRIQRDGHTMVEVEPGSIAVDASPAVMTVAALQAAAFGDERVRVRGEIVDSKCFLGVMVPGSGKTHADCASLCLRGGIPPALYVTDRNGGSALMLVVDAAGEPIGAPAFEVAGQAIEVTGVLARQGGWLVLRTDPGTWHPLTSREARSESATVPGRTP